MNWNMIAAHAMVFATFAVVLVAALWVSWVRPAEEEAARNAKRAEEAERQARAIRAHLEMARRGLSSATERVLELSKTHPNERPTLAP